MTIHQRLDYRIEIKPRNKTLRLLIIAGEVVIRHNGRASLAQIEQLLAKHQTWIQAQINKYKTQQKRRTETTQTFYYLGLAYAIEAVDADSSAIYLQEATPGSQQGRCQLHCRDIASERDNLIGQFCLNACHATIMPILQQRQQQMHCKPSQVQFKLLSSKWGSCNQRNALVFNAKLMQLPILIIDYIIVHELAHIQHKHHGPSFWQMVAEFCPNYPVLLRQLRHFEKYHEIMVIAPANHLY